MISTNTLETKKTMVEALLPGPGRLALVQCERFRCLAYRDQKGRWKDFCSEEVLPDVINVVAILE